MADGISPHQQVPLRRALADIVYEIVIQRFMDGSLEPGQPLNIDALAREVQVSQTPIREALARLEHTGLVRREALRGYRVAELFSETELVNLMEARLVLEPVLAGLAATRMDTATLARLAQTLEDLESVANVPEDVGFGPYWSVDELFHGIVATTAANPFLLRAHEALGGQIQRFRFFGELGHSDAEFAAAEHRVIFEALRDGDSDRAEAAMRSHIEGARDRAIRDRQAVND